MQMAKNARKRKKTTFTAAFYKELVMSALAVLSVALLLFEYFASPDQTVRQAIIRFDFVVACIFLVDFCVATYRAPNRAEYVVHNWYLLLAAIPIVDGWTELLRGLRVFELIRLVRAGSHLTYVYETVKPHR